MDPRCSTPTAMHSQGYSPSDPAPSAPLQTPTLSGEYSSTDLVSYEAAKPSQVATLSRQPLQESTGNAKYQHHHQDQHTQQPQPPASAHYPTYSLPSLPSLPSSTTTRSCTPLHHFGGPLIPPAPTVPTPPSILQSNATSQHHPHHAAGGSSTAGLSALRLRRYQYDTQRQKRSRNPLYACPEFAQYRLKQKEKDRQVWPDDLELYFQDCECL